MLRLAGAVALARRSSARRMRHGFITPSYGQDIHVEGADISGGTARERERGTQ